MQNNSDNDDNNIKYTNNFYWRIFSNSSPILQGSVISKFNFGRERHYSAGARARRGLMSVLNLTIVRAFNLVNKDGAVATLAHGASCDPYVKVYVANRLASRTSTMRKNLSPEWNEQVRARVPKRGEALQPQSRRAPCSQRARAAPPPRSFSPPNDGPARVFFLQKNGHRFPPRLPLERYCSTTALTDSRGAHRGLCALPSWTRTGTGTSPPWERLF